MAIKHSIEGLLWNDNWFLDLDMKHRYLFIHLLTSNNGNVAGIYEVSFSYINLILGLKDSKKMIKKLYPKIMLDEKNNIIWIKNYYFKNTMNNPLMDKATANVLRKYKKSPLIYNFLEHYSKVLSKKDKFLKSLMFDTDGAPLMYITDKEEEEEVDIEVEGDVVVEEEKEKKYEKEIKEIIDHFNKVTGKKYKYTNKLYNEKINARLKDGFKVADFIKVIDTKHNDWYNDDKMKKFIRPETLFSSKFETYLNDQFGKSGFDLEAEKFLAKGKEEECTDLIF